MFLMVGTVIVVQKGREGRAEDGGNGEERNNDKSQRERGCSFFLFYLTSD